MNRKQHIDADAEEVPEEEEEGWSSREAPARSEGQEEADEGGG